VIVAAAVVGLAFGMGGVFMGHALFELPAPTGPFPVGTASFAVPRPVQPGDAAPGQFVVQMWYPALASNVRAPYGTGTGGVKAWLYHHLVRTHSTTDAVAADRQSSVLLYVPAWGGERTENTALIEELASHGYAVAAFDDVSRDVPVLDGLAGPFDVSSEQSYRASIELANRRLAYEMHRASSVLDYLRRLNDGDDRGRFTGRLDLRRVGIFGYSFGGAVALETCRRDRRFLAAMNFDGLLFGAADGYDGGIPYFLVSDSNPLPTPAELASDDPAVRYMSKLIVGDAADQRAALRHAGYELLVGDSKHASFNDSPLYAPLQRLRAGWSNPPRITAALRQYTLAFFDEVLYGTPSPLLAAGTRGRPPMTLAVGGPVASQ
jgi:dienelactone hydrolase